MPLLPHAESKLQDYGLLHLLPRLGAHSAGAGEGAPPAGTTAAAQQPAAEPAAAAQEGAAVLDAGGGAGGVLVAGGAAGDVDLAVCQVAADALMAEQCRSMLPASNNIGVLDAGGPSSSAGGRGRACAPAAPVCGHKRLREEGEGEEAEAGERRVRLSPHAKERDELMGLACRLGSKQELDDLLKYLPC